MIESIFQTFILLGTFDIILISVSIANYAISASYLGRETRLTRGRMEKRKEKLKGIIKELQAKGLPIEELKKETKKAEDYIGALGHRLFLLSWLGAVILPSIFFIGSLVSVVIGMNSDIFLTNSQTQNATVNGLMSTSISSLGLGFLCLMIVIGVIDSAARKIPIPEFEVYFEKGKKVLKLKRNERRTIELSVHNKGEDVGENLHIFVNFPPAFNVNEGYYIVAKQTFETEYPDYNAVIFKVELTHIDTTTLLYIDLTPPDEKRTYEIPIHIYERKMGLSKHQLSIEVVD